MTSYPLTDTIIVRAMHPKDLDRVHEIDQLSFNAPWPDSAYQYELDDNPRSSLWVAEDISISGNSRILGMVVTWFIVDEAHIATLAVHPTHRGKGVAKRLLSAALEEAFHKGMQSATLEVRANNLVAQELYRHFGFEVVGHRPRYYRDNNEDAVIMTVNLQDEPAVAPGGNTAPDPR